MGRKVRLDSTGGTGLAGEGLRGDMQDITCLLPQVGQKRQS